MGDSRDLPPEGQLSQAEELFAAYLEERGDEQAPPASEPDFQALCNQHPELAGELRRIRGGWSEAALFFGGTDSAAGDPADEAPAELPSAAGSKRTKPRYTIRGEVARGGMGVILNVWDHDLRRELAMKTMRDPASALSPGSKPPLNSRLLSRFLEEAQVTGQMEHPGIVPVHELGLDAEGRFYFTMPMIRGRDLGAIFALVRKSAEGWTRTRALQVLLRVSEAMASAHAKGVLHRDLKPANIMVGPFEETYVMDWGLARVLSGAVDQNEPSVPAADQHSPSKIYSQRAEAKALTPDSALLTHDGDVVGTPAYMSPEQARGDLEQLSERSDVYSLGAILYELLAGTPPHVRPGESSLAPQAHVARILERRPDPVHSRDGSVPAELAAICERAMSFDPGGRYPGMLAFAADLRAYLEERVVSAYRTGAFAELGKWVQRNRALALTGVAAFATLVLGLLATWTLLIRVRESEEVAQQEREIAQEERARVLGLSDLKRLAHLTARDSELWPARPGQVDAYAEWLDSAQVLFDRAEQTHQPALSDMRARALKVMSEDGAERWSFESTEAQWHHDTLAELVTAIDQLRASETSLLEDIRSRKRFAETVHERTVSSPEAAQAWSVAQASIYRSEEYGKLELEPQVGLLPLGPDPDSGLWEFAELETGEAPSRDAAGHLELTDGTGLVFVLVPGGEFTIGAQAEDPDAPNYDPEASAQERPAHRREVGHFFISKYEMTQGQYLRFTGTNPSHYHIGSKTGPPGKYPGARNPVENLDWFTVCGVLERLGLRLPTEAEWEYAARAGTSTPFWTGTTKETLEGAANIADSSATRSGANWQDILDWPELDDGYVIHAPVGTYRANPFGLHDTHGNLEEFCSDDWAGDYGNFTGSDDPPTPHPEFATRRGGSYGNKAYNARVSYRHSAAKSTAILIVGIRPVRSLD